MYQSSELCNCNCFWQLVLLVRSAFFPTILKLPRGGRAHLRVGLMLNRIFRGKNSIYIYSLFIHILYLFIFIYISFFEYIVEGHTAYLVQGVSAFTMSWGRSRSQRRNAEIAGLKEAMSVLEGLSFVQRAGRKGHHMRGSLSVGA